MIRTISYLFLATILLLGAASPLVADEVEASTSSTGSMESAYRTWAESLEDDGSWELQMPPTPESDDLVHLQNTILESLDGSHLDPGQKAGYLVALADRTALEGDRARARSFYRVLGSSQVPLLVMWSAYMQAGLDFAEGVYASASAGYDRVCTEGTPTEWRDHACAMAGLAQRLDALQLDGGDHGDPVTETP